MGTTISARVLIVAVVSAALGALGAAVLAIVAVDRLLSVQADQRLVGAAIELAGELDEEHGGVDDERLVQELDDENQEIAPSGIRLGVFRQGLLVAGEAPDVRPEMEGCVTTGGLGERVRACAQRHGGVVLVAAVPTDERRLRLIYLAACVGALLVGAGSGAAMSAPLGRWAVAPLRKLADTLRASRPERGASIDLGPPSPCEDVEAIRKALSALMLHVDELLDHAHRFAANAAHELRTPLTTLRAELELLIEEAAGDDREALQRATEKVTRLSLLMERLLVLALPTQKVEGGFETVALEDVVERVVGGVAARDRRRLEVVCEGEGLVWGDAYLLGILVSNAMENALKHGGDGTVSIRVSPSEDSLESVMEVVDRGPGLGELDATRVFEAFYRGPKSGVRGHGLGLALVGHIAGVHGGRAEFRESPRGAHLVVSLPAWSPRARSAAGEGAKPV